MTLATNGRLAAILATGVLAAGAALVPPAHARDLTVVTWGGAFQEAQGTAFFKPFRAETKTNMQEVSWDGGIGILRAKVQAGNLDWDVVEVESDELALGCEEGLFQKLDFDKIGGKDIYLPEFVHPCGIGAVLYNFVIGYNGDKIKDDPKDWADFFDLKKYPGKRAMRSGPKPNFELALLADGVDPKDVYKVLATDEGVARAFKKLDTIKSSVIWWQTGNQPINLLMSNEVTFAATYSGQLAGTNRNQGTHLKRVWNQSLYNVDSWVILKGSPNTAQAYQFLNFIGDPNHQKDFPQYITSGMSNRKTVSLLDKSLVVDMPTEPANMEHAIRLNVEFWLENYDKLNDRFVKWSAQ